MTDLIRKSAKITNKVRELWLQGKKKDAMDLIHEQNQQLSTVIVAKLCCHLTPQEIYNLSLLLENKL